MEYYSTKLDLFITFHTTADQSIYILKLKVNILKHNTVWTITFIGYSCTSFKKYPIFPQRFE